MSSRLQQKLLEESSDVVTIIDTEGVIRYVSPSVERMLGTTPTSWLAATVGQP